MATRMGRALVMAMLLGAIVTAYAQQAGAQ